MKQTLDIHLRSLYSLTNYSRCC